MKYILLVYGAEDAWTEDGELGTVTVEMALEEKSKAVHGPGRVHVHGEMNDEP